MWCWLKIGIDWSVYYDYQKKENNTLWYKTCRNGFRGLSFIQPTSSISSEGKRVFKIWNSSATLAIVSAKRG